MTFDPNVIKIRDFSDNNVAYYDEDRMVYVLKNGEEWSKEFVEDRRWFAEKQFRKDAWDARPWWKKIFSLRPI